MLRYSLFALAGVASCLAQDLHIIQVGAAGLLQYDPPSIMGNPGDIVSFHFNPKNHSVTQSSFEQPCSPFPGGLDSGFHPVAPDAPDMPVWNTTIPPADPNTGKSGPFWFHCKQKVGDHCGHGMVFAINPDTDPNGQSLDKFRAAALATGANATTSSSDAFTTPPPQPLTIATATITNAQSSVWTTTYISYLGSLPPTPAPQPSTHMIDVGPDGHLAFFPPNITASVNDTVTFVFHPKNHTMTQSSFNDPCSPITSKPGFDSGFMPVSADSSDNPTFSITINDTAPIWIYCRQTDHCRLGMVMAINAVEGGPNNFENFRQIALNSGKNSSLPAGSAGAPAPSGSSSPSKSEGVAAITKPHLAGGLFGLIVLMAAML